MGCPRNGEVCNEFYCGGNSYGVCVAGDDARIEDFMAAHDREIRRQTINEFIDRFNQTTFIMGRSTGRTFMLKCLNEIADEMKGEAEENE